MNECVYLVFKINTYENNMISVEMKELVDVFEGSKQADELAKKIKGFVEEWDIKKEKIMKRTEILCVECMKKKLIHEKGKELYCDECGTRFEFIDEENETYIYKEGE